MLQAVCQYRYLFIKSVYDKYWLRALGIVFFSDRFLNQGPRYSVTFSCMFSFPLYNFKLHI